MAKFCPLFSSSGGNSVYIGSGDSGILIDVGKSAKQTEEALYNIGVDPDSLNAVFVTHEHCDHIQGLRVFASRHHIKIYATPGTLSALEENGTLNEKTEYDALCYDGNEAGSLFVMPFHTLHDSRESCGYVVETPDGRKIAVATDLGIMTNEVKKAITGCDLVMLESNHDIRMLENGPYPYPLKKRILGERGHLSNDTCAEAAVQLVKDGTTRLFLGHLSKENNFPELAYQTTFAALTADNIVIDSDCVLKVAKPVWDSRAIIL